MTKKQSELFQYALEEVESQLHDLLDTHIEHRQYESAEYMFEGLKHVGAILKNFDGDIKREDVKWVVVFLFGKNGDHADGYELFEAVNASFEICTDKEVEELIDELLNM